MAKIIVLSDVVCNQIAAGEVVERPAAVVKELVENSIDAKSGRISIAVLAGGRKEIRVADDGGGMDSEDALLALERHATSKIRTADDLHHIHSLGFRGEALPSIAAVSRFELTTRERDAISGVTVSMEGGVLRNVREAGCPSGTTITVRDLFFNIPARRKFLRSIDTEMSHINDQILRVAMAYPEIHFRHSHEERTQYDFPAAKDLAQRASQVLGSELSGALHPFDDETPPLRMHGLAGSPDFHRANAGSIFVYVNRRPVQDRSLNRSVLSAYEALIPRGRFPVAVLFLEIPTESVDVNSHPAKREVRFQNSGQVFAFIRDGLRKALDGIHEKRWSAPLPPRREREPELEPPAEKWTFQEPRQTLDASPQSLRKPCPVESRSPQRSFVLPRPSGPSRTTPPIDLPEAPSPNALPPEAPREPDGEPLFAGLPVIGQLANAYILLESPEGLVLIDQHAAHERVLFDRLASSPRGGASQRLLKPVVVELLPKEAATLRRWTENLVELGFELEPFGGDSFAIQAVPAALSGMPPAELLRSLVESDHEERDAPQISLAEALAKTAACHGAIRVGQRLHCEEIVELLQALDRTRSSATCPHGRPLWWKLTYKEIAGFFNRK